MLSLFSFLLLFAASYTEDCLQTPFSGGRVNTVGDVHHTIATEHAYPCEGLVIEAFARVVKTLVVHKELAAFSSGACSKLLTIDEVTAAAPSPANEIERQGRLTLRPVLAKLGLLYEDGPKLTVVDSFVSVDPAKHPDLAAAFPGKFPLQDKVCGVRDADTANPRLCVGMHTSVVSKSQPYVYGMRDGPAAFFFQFQHRDGSGISGDFVSIVPAALLAAKGILRTKKNHPLGEKRSSDGVQRMNVPFDFHSRGNQRGVGEVVLNGLLYVGGDASLRQADHWTASEVVKRICGGGFSTPQNLLQLKQAFFRQVAPPNTAYCDAFVKKCLLVDGVRAGVSQSEILTQICAHQAQTVVQQQAYWAEQEQRDFLAENAERWTGALVRCPLPPQSVTAAARADPATAWGYKCGNCRV